MPCAVRVMVARYLAAGARSAAPALPGWLAWATSVSGTRGVGARATNVRRGFMPTPPVSATPTNAETDDESRSPAGYVGSRWRRRRGSTTEPWRSVRLAAMTDLLSRASSRPSTTAPQTGRPLALGALLAGLGSPAVALSLLWFVGLVGWYADDGGSHGTTRSVLRVGADAWLLAHGSPLTLNHLVVTASPLGLTLLCGYLTYRLGR